MAITDLGDHEHESKSAAPWKSSHYFRSKYPLTLLPPLLDQVELQRNVLGTDYKLMR